MHQERKKIYTVEDFDICAFSPIDLLTEHVKDKLDKYAVNGHLVFDGNQMNTEQFVSVILEKAFTLIIDDIIDNNVTIHFHGMMLDDVQISMRLMHAAKYRAKKSKVIDVSNDNNPGPRMFPLYMIMMRCPSWRSDGVLPIMVDDKRRERIRERMEKGLSYGDGKVDRTMKDYALQLSTYTNGMSYRVIRFILHSAFYRAWVFKKELADIYIPIDDGWCYIGILKNFKELTGRQMRHRVLNKVSVWRKFMNIKQSDYCYAVLNQSQYDKVCDKSNDIIQVQFYDTLAQAMIFVMDGQYYFKVKKFPLSYKKGARKYIPATQINNVQMLDRISDMAFVEYIGKHWKEVLNDELKKVA